MQVGSPGGTSLLRAFAQQHCGVIQPSVPTTMLLSRRAGTRELGNRGFLVHALKDLAKARGLSFVEMDHGAADFCTQVYSVARAAIIVAVHGAFWANAPFFHSRALAVEINVAPSWYVHHTPDEHDKTWHLDQCDYGHHNLCRQLSAQGQPFLLADIAAVEGPKGLCVSREWLTNPHCKVNVPIMPFLDRLLGALQYLDAAGWFHHGKHPETGRL